jgi:hypothetical protein
MVIDVLNQRGMNQPNNCSVCCHLLAAMNSLGRVYAQPPRPAKAGKVGNMSSPKSSRRSGEAISSDIRECAEIWLRRAEELFGNHAMVDDFNNAVKCAERFGGQLRGRKKSKSGSPSRATPRQVVEAASTSGASHFARA